MSRIEKGEGGLKRSRGFLIVLSGPSGSGKNTLVNEILRIFPDIRYSVSATTRPRGPGEIDGKDYYFVTPERFDEMIKNNDLLEWATVYGHRYGTPRGPIEENIKSGLDVILDIDIQGARQVRARWPEGVFVFLLPPSLDELRRRIMRRSRDSRESIELRLRSACDELKAVNEYDYVIVNDTIEDATGKLAAVITAERLKVKRYEWAPDRWPRQLGRDKTDHDAPFA
ncbi:MAG TPA: guanylate kinase [Firmicutes bacterium]|nr:guanylate kinase [Bacillota bacterium]